METDGAAGPAADPPQIPGSPDSLVSNDFRHRHGVCEAILYNFFFSMNHNFHKVDRLECLF